MIRPPGLALAFLALSFGSHTASAQPPPAGLQIGAGVVAPVGDARSASGTGWDVSVAGDVEIRPGLAARIDYLYGRFAAEEMRTRALAISSLPARFGTLRAKTQAHIGALDIVWRLPWRGGRGSVYVLGGPVLALRRVTITSVRTDLDPAFFNETLVAVCEPLWLECAGDAVPYHRVLGIRRSVDVGVNVGAGLTFDVGLNARLFAEGRYVLLDGPGFRDVSGATRSADAMYVPLVAGIRFQFH